MSDPNIEPSNPFAVYLAATFSAAITIGALDVPLVGYVMNNTPATTTNMPARRLRCSGAGNVVVKYPNGTTDTLAFLAGETQYVQVSTIIKVGTTATGITAYW